MELEKLENISDNIAMCVNELTDEGKRDYADAFDRSGSEQAHLYRLRITMADSSINVNGSISTFVFLPYQYSMRLSVCSKPSGMDGIAGAFYVNIIQADQLENLIINAVCRAVAASSIFFNDRYVLLRLLYRLDKRLAVLTSTSLLWNFSIISMAFCLFFSTFP